MKRLSFLIVPAALAFSFPALANEHLMKVGEVLLSNSGDPTAQYVELVDLGNEQFPNPPYRLGIYDSAGASQGTIALTVDPGTKRLFVGTTAAASAFGVTNDAVLNIALPSPGQACFEKTAGGARIHCLSWGTVATPVTGTSGTSNGAAPADSMSLQLIGTNYVVTVPTPDAPNMVPTPDAGPNAGPDAGDAPGSPDSGPGGPPADDDGGGCGCRAASNESLASGGLLLIAVIALSRRRRAR